MTRAEFLNALRNLRMFSQNGQRAPHKPLLILLMLGRIQQGINCPITWPEIRTQLGQLLEDFGRPSKAVHPEFPFWHLQSDRFWVLANVNGAVNAGISKMPTLREFSDQAYVGHFTQGLIHLLQTDQSLLTDAAQLILESNFPVTLHEDLQGAVGLTFDLPAPPIPDLSSSAPTAPCSRSSSFRHAVLTAYRQRCCVCGFSLRMGNQLVGVEAAHIRWVKARGPNVVSNGMAMCSIHHKLFDHGAFTVLENDWRLKVSGYLNGDRVYFDALTQYANKEIFVPDLDSDTPRAEFLRWHRSEVFRATQSQRDELP